MTVKQELTILQVVTNYYVIEDVKFSNNILTFSVNLCTNLFNTISTYMSLPENMSSVVSEDPSADVFGNSEQLLKKHFCSSHYEGSNLQLDKK